MKKLFFLLIAFSLFADEDYESYSYWDFHPLHSGGAVIAIGKADVEPKRIGKKKGEIVFNKAYGFVSLIVPVSRTSYFIPRFEINAFTMNWDKNPKFHETHFQYFQYALTFFSIAVEKWRWIARADYNMDLKHLSHASYGLFSALLWGTHELHRKWHYHLGALGYKGLEGQMVYPIIGIDFAPNKKWFFQVVFPITYSIEYAFNKEWRLALKGRPLKERFRTGPNEPQPRSVFSYSSTGAELNLHYEKFLRLEAEAFAGYNFGGGFYIKNKGGHNAYYTSVQGAFYGGANINWGF